MQLKTNGHTLIEMLCAITMASLFMLGVIAAFQYISIQLVFMQQEATAAEDLLLLHTCLSKLISRANDYDVYNAHPDGLSISNHVLTVQYLDPETTLVAMQNARRLTTAIALADKNNAVIADTQHQEPLLIQHQSKELLTLSTPLQYAYGRGAIIGNLNTHYLYLKTPNLYLDKEVILNHITALHLTATSPTRLMVTVAWHDSAYSTTETWEFHNANT